nr:cytidine deaminase [Legionella adelaidensis]
MKLKFLFINEQDQVLSNAYAPYSRFHVSACIRSEQDKLFTGVNVENGSYGLTLCAEGSAIAQMVTAGYRQIKEMVILCSTNQLCPPCGACRQRIQEFASPETLIHLCNNETILKSISMKDLLPLAFNFDGTVL